MASSDLYRACCCEPAGPCDCESETIEFDWAGELIFEWDEGDCFGLTFPECSGTATQQFFYSLVITSLSLTLTRDGRGCNYFGEYTWNADSTSCNDPEEIYTQTVTMYVTLAKSPAGAGGQWKVYIAVERPSWGTTTIARWTYEADGSPDDGDCPYLGTYSPACSFSDINCPDSGGFEPLCSGIFLWSNLDAGTVTLS